MAITCTTCGQVFGDRDSLRLHYDSDAHDSLPWKCERLCGRAFDTPEALAHHQSVAPLHHCLDDYVRLDASSGEEILWCEDCRRRFNYVNGLYQHLLFNDRHRIPEEELVPHGNGEPPSLESIVEFLARQRRLEEEEEEQRRQQQESEQLAQDDHPSSPPETSWESEDPPSDWDDDYFPASQSTGWSSSTFSWGSPTPDSVMNTPPDHLDPFEQDLASNEQTVDPINRQGLVGSGANSSSSNSFHPSQSSQSVRTPLDNEPNSAIESTLKNRKTLIPVSHAERKARALAKLPVFGPPTLEQELVAMSAKMAAMEAELQAAKDALKRNEAQRQCVMCFERDVDSVTKCGHQFCLVCIESWQSEHRSPWQTPCPVCRKAMGKAIRVYAGSSV
ncbi:hypothetical protein ACHAPT_012769 [Fusarium lateritium]